MTEQIKLEEFSISQLNNISGNHDENLKLIEDTFGISITLRGDELLLTGDNATNFDKAKKVIQTLIELVSKKITISRRDVVYALKLVEQDNLKHINELYNIRITKTASGKMIYPKTLGQKDYYFALKNNDVVFGIGPAGTGKTYLAVVFAVDALKNNVVKKIVLTRPAVEAGENLGFLPGDLKEKVDPYLRPLYDALHDMLGVEQTERLIEIELPEELSSNLKADKLFLESYNINPNLKFAYQNKRIKITLMLKPNDKHFLYTFVPVLELINENYFPGNN